MTNAGAIANDALRYNGAGYMYGGAPANGIGKWDCSSFVSWVMGHDMKMSVPMYPNGSYTGHAHGPTAAQYLVWSGATSIARNAASAGDLACWVTHIGIVTGPDQMISAYSTRTGTLVTGINGAGPTGEPLVIRRVNGTAASGAGNVATNALGFQGCQFPTAMIAMISYAVLHRTKFRRYIPGNQHVYRQSTR